MNLSRSLSRSNQLSKHARKTRFGYAVEALLLATSLALGSCSVWEGLENLSFPQNEKDLQVLRQVARPDGIDLLAESALSALQKDKNILGLKTTDGRYEYFFYVVPPAISGFSELQDLVKFTFPAFLERKPVGFVIHDFPVDNLKLTGREYYFDSRYRLCDGMLFSTRPLESAKFLLIIFDQTSSLAALEKPGLLCVFAHAESEVFKQIKSH